MKFTSAALAAIFASTAYSHSTVTNVLLNGVDQGMTAPVHGIGNTMNTTGYIRVPKNNDPVKDITSSAMACNVNNTAAPKSISAAAGDKLIVQWHHDAVTPQDDIIDSSHKGPIMTYIAPAAGNGAGDVWVKIAEEGYDTTSKTWAVDKLIANKGMKDVVIPSTLATGDYLVRQEIIALHEADTDFAKDPARGAQLYISCMQLTVATGGGTALPAGVAFPGAYKTADVIFDLKAGKPETFNIPGPAVWAAATGSVAANTTSAAKTAKAARRNSSARFRRDYLP